MKLTSNAGHSAKSTGASGNGYKEHEVARLVNAEFIRQAQALGHTVIDSTSNAASQQAVLNEQIKIANASGAELGISHHFNSFGDSSANGVEVFHYAKNAKSAAIAAKVSAAISAHYGLRNRGAKSNPLQWTSKTSMPAILIEWGFISNSNDMKKITADISGGVAAALKAITGGVVAQPSAPAPVAPKPAPVKSAYTLTRLLRRGSKGADVKKLQQALNKLGHKLVVDGDFGPKTAKAVALFQGSKHLKRDSIVGKATARALGWAWGV